MKITTPQNFISSNHWLQQSGANKQKLPLSVQKIKMWLPQLFSSNNCIVVQIEILKSYLCVFLLGPKDFHYCSKNLPWITLNCKPNNIGTLFHYLYSIVMLRLKCLEMQHLPRFRLHNLQQVKMRLKNKWRKWCSVDCNRTKYIEVNNRIN